MEFKSANTKKITITLSSPEQTHRSPEQTHRSPEQTHRSPDHQTSESTTKKILIFDSDTKKATTQNGSDSDTPSKPPRQHRRFVETSQTPIPEKHFDWHYQQIHLLSMHSSSSSMSSSKQKINPKLISNIREHILKKISSYKQQDILKHNVVGSSIISFVEVIDKLVQSGCRCFYCNDPVLIYYKNIREPKQWTLDRIVNEGVGHTNENTLIACLECNLRRRCIDKDKFDFTCNLTIAKVEGEADCEGEGGIRDLECVGQSLSNEPSTKLFILNENWRRK